MLPVLLLPLFFSLSSTATLRPVVTGAEEMAREPEDV